MEDDKGGQMSSLVTSNHKNSIEYQTTSKGNNLLSNLRVFSPFFLELYYSIHYFVNIVKEKTICSVFVINIGKS